MDKYLNKRLDGRYEIRELIGVGGMAYVYKAYDTIDDRIVGVKILKDEFLSNEEFTRRFKNESKAIAILSHPNIVKVYDVSFGDRLQYIVMEYIDGITLKEYMDQQKDIRWKEAVHFTVQILRALQHAHDKGIVHRDIKPQNIMLLPDGTIKVTDFGIARFARHDMRLTGEADKAIGSVHYISPEQARGAITDEKADIYSVGIMMYEMLTGQLPFEADNAVSVAIMQMQAEPRQPCEINPEIPEGLEEITIKAMQKDPLRRYQSAAEMLYDIDEFKRNPSIHFTYKYFVDETPTKFVETITRVRGEEEYDEEYGLEEEQEEKKGPPVIPILAAITGAFVVLTLLFVGAVFFLDLFKNDKDGEIIEIDNFIGKKYEDIINDGKYENWTFEWVKAANDSYDEGVVFKQDKNRGTTQNIKIPIVLTVSTGPPPVTVPQIPSSRDYESYAEILKSMNLIPIKKQKADDRYEVGKVVQVVPEPGESIKAGEEVYVYVNDPNEVEPVSVPGVVGVNVDAAIKSLRDRGLVVNKNNIEFVNHESRGKNAVISQTPAEGTNATPGEVVVLKVSTGFRNVEVKTDQFLPKKFEGMLEFQVLINGVARKEYSSNGQIQPSAYGKNLVLTENDISQMIEHTYKVTIQIKPAGASDSKYELYKIIEVYGVSGGPAMPIKVLEDREIPFLTTTTTTTTTTTADAATTTTTTSIEDPSTTTTTTLKKP